jgi:outer membrane protein assembly factor BamB
MKCCCLSLRSWLPLLALAALLWGFLTQTFPDQPALHTNHVAMFGGGPQRNMVNLIDKNIPTTWNVKEKERKNIKWVADLGNISYGAPVVADGKVFVGTNNGKPRNPQIKGDKGVLMCFRESDGQFLWQAVHDKLPDEAANDNALQGIASTAAVDGKRLYYVSNRCELVCASTEGKPGTQEAELIWTLDMIKEFGVYPRLLANCSPLVVGDLVYVITGNGISQGTTGEESQVPAPKAPSFLAVNKNTGKPVWKSDLPGNKIMDGQWSNPTFAEVNGKGQVLFAGGDGWLYALEPKTGELIWKFDCNPKNSVFKANGRCTKGYLLSTPVFHDNKVYIGVGFQPDTADDASSHFWCIDATKTGDLSPVNDNFDPKAPENKNSGLVWHFGGPADAKTAAESKRDYLFGRTISTCAIHDDLVYVADLVGFVHCFDAQTGQRYWYHDLLDTVWGSPYWVDGKIYIGDQGGDVVIFTHGKEKKEPVKVEIGSPVRTSVTVANGVLYVMTERRLYAIAAK